MYSCCSSKRFMKPSAQVESLPQVMCFPTLLIPCLFPMDVSSFIVATTSSMSTKRQMQASWKHLAENYFYVHAIANHYFASSLPQKGLDFSRLSAGICTQELRRNLVHESILLCISQVTRPPQRAKTEQVPLIAGSYALHHWMHMTEGTSPPWAPGDVDIWIPNTMDTILIAAELRSLVFCRYGIVLAYASQYSTIYESQGMRQLGPRDGTCRVAHMCNLTFNVDDPYSLLSPNVDPALKKRRETACLSPMKEQSMHVRYFLEDIITTILNHSSHHLPARNEFHALARMHCRTRAIDDWLQGLPGLCTGMNSSTRCSSVSVSSYMFLRYIAVNWIDHNSISAPSQPYIQLSHYHKQQIERMPWFEQYNKLVCGGNPSPLVHQSLSQQICKVSLIAVIGSQIFPVPYGIHTRRAWRNVVSHLDILDRFDISICMCGFYISQEEGAHANRHVFVLSDKVKEHISTRKGHIMPYLHINDKRRIMRIAKYKERGFAIIESP